MILRGLLKQVSRQCVTEHQLDCCGGDNSVGSRGQPCSCKGGASLQKLVDHACNVAISL